MIKEASDADGSMNEALRVFQQRQSEYQSQMMAEMESQKKVIIEQTRVERERARKEREELIARIKTTSSSSKKVIKKEIKTEKAQPQIQVPPVHPFYGPAVYDYNANHWTYPYAQWYGVGGEAPKSPPIESKEPVVEIIEKVEPPPEMVDAIIGVNPPSPKRPVLFEIGT